ncbi:MAG: 2-isopropylmalate synthase [Rhodothermales bacterium]|nr:2-isopropylmalate synthase [Rhodothermales bacterium]
MTEQHIIIFDTTLRDGEQAPGAAMTIPEKLKIAHELARLGVDVIEAGFPVSSPGQSEAVRRIASEVEGPVICGLARAKEADVKAAADALRPAGRARIHTFIATSDIHLESKFADARYGASLSDKRRTVMDMAVQAVELALTYTDDVEFSAEDAGRTDIGYLHDVIRAVVEAGATTVNIPDTTGYCMPGEYAELIRSIVDIVKDTAVVVSTHCHDDLGLAAANSLSGVKAGARQIECTINGIGERAGNAALEEVVMALRVREDRFGVQTGIDSKLLAPISKLVSTFSGFPVQPNKAIVGRNAFAHEAGIHQDGVLKRRETYEIMSAADVGQEAESIRLGRHSGRHGLFSRLKAIGIPVGDNERDALYDAFVKLADQKKEISDIDLYNLSKQQTHPMNSLHYRLEHVDLSVGSDREPVATVRVRNMKFDRLQEKSATGDGPIDALYRAIDHAVEEAHDLVSYNIRSISEGADAFGEVNVLIRFGGPCFAGKASSTDVILASAEAYMNALNSLAAYRVDEKSIQFVNEGIMQAFEGGEA